MTIGQVAVRAGLATSAIRYYESVGVLPEARRAAGQRRYDTEVLDRLGVSRLAKDAGFAIAEIRVLIGGFADAVPPSSLWHRLAHRKLEEIDETVRRAERMRALLHRGLRCECLTLSDCSMAAERPYAEDAGGARRSAVR